MVSTFDSSSSDFLKDASLVLCSVQVALDSHNPDFLLFSNFSHYFFFSFSSFSIFFLKNLPASFFPVQVSFLALSDGTLYRSVS